MTEFILVITEFYTPITDGFAHFSRQVAGLVCWPISSTLLSYIYNKRIHCMHYERVICGSKKVKPIF